MIGVSENKNTKGGLFKTSFFIGKQLVLPQQKVYQHP